VAQKPRAPRTIRKPRLHTPEQVTDEKRKLYRDFINKRITRSEYEGHLKGLDSLHSGMLKQGDSVNGSAGYTPPEIRIFSVPSSCFLSLEQLKTLKEGGSIVDIAQCTPTTFESLPDPVDERKNVVPLRLEEPAEPEPNSNLSALEQKLLGMSPEQLLELARSLNVGS
jgi:hypothetical protein